jgi:hypothetical protein
MRLLQHEASTLKPTRSLLLAWISFIYRVPCSLLNYCSPVLGSALYCTFLSDTPLLTFMCDDTL